MKARILLLLSIAAIFLSITISGCSQQTIDSAKNDAQHDAAVVSQSANQAARQAKPKLDAASLGLRVTTAIAANQNLPHDTIRVDASPTGVRLSGTVKTAEQKQLAGRVARDTLGPDKTVENELKVAG